MYVLDHKLKFLNKYANHSKNGSVNQKISERDYT